MTERPRILLVPSWSEAQWAIKPELERWAQVASYDPPGVGAEPRADGPLFEAIVARGLAEIERLGWERCVVAGDDLGAVAATAIAAAEPERVAGLALGHPCLEHRLEGERPTMNREVADISRQLVELDFRAFIRQDVGIWDPRPGHRLESADELVEELTRRVPTDLAARLLDELDAVASEGGASLEPVLRELDVPLLFAEHAGCVLFTPHGFADAVAAFPEAATVSTHASPGLSPEFAAALRELAQRVG